MRGGADVSHVWARVYTLVRSCGVKCAAARQPVGSLWRFALPCLLLHSSWVTCYRMTTRPASPDSGAGKSRGQHGCGRRGACGPPGQLPPSPGMCGQALRPRARRGAGRHGAASGSASAAAVRRCNEELGDGLDGVGKTEHVHLAPLRRFVLRLEGWRRQAGLEPRAVLGERGAHRGRVPCRVAHAWSARKRAVMCYGWVFFLISSARLHVPRAHVGVRRIVRAVERAESNWTPIG